MKLFICLLTLLFSISSFSQREDYIEIDGTNCLITPPLKFVQSKVFSGLQDTISGETIIVKQFPVSFNKSTVNLLKNGFQSKKMIVVDNKIDSSFKDSALLKFMQMQDGEKVFFLTRIFGDSNMTTVVTGMYTDTSNENEIKIKRALFSTITHVKKSSSFLNADYSVDNSGTDFKFYKYLSNNLIYYKLTKSSPEKSTYFVGKAFGELGNQDMKTFAIETLKKLDNGENYSVKQISSVKIDNLSGIEIIAFGKPENKNEELIYLLLLFVENEKYYYKIYGNAIDDFELNLYNFRKISKTFRRK